PAQPTSSAGVLGMPGAYGASSGVLPEYSGQQQEAVKIADGDWTISAGDDGSWRTTGDLFDDHDDSGVGLLRGAETERGGTAR
ncbi:MAG: hypothetical protein ACRDQ5_02010, partial [Sciscionella sp.]